jgi:sensor domain CHASE-containing protein
MIWIAAGGVIAALLLILVALIIVVVAARPTLRHAKALSLKTQALTERARVISQRF